MGVQDHDTSRMSWGAAASGSFDPNVLISEFQTALIDEIGELKRQNAGRKTEVYDGHRIFRSNMVNVYKFSSDDVDDWFKRKPQTELTVKINGEEIFGRLDSADKENINVALEIDRGEYIEEATLEDSSFFLLEKLNIKLANIKSGEFAINIDGSMKLFGFDQPDYFTPISFSEQKLVAFKPNCEQEIAIRKALSQEITFIWGPPGTGKTKTLAFILGLLIAAGKKVLLTANTNAAVDEILRKFLDNKENDSFIQQGKIIRLGNPSLEDERMTLLIPKVIAEKRNEHTKNIIASIQKEIDLDTQKIVVYNEQEKNIVSNDLLLKELNSDLRKTQMNIEIVRSKIETAKKNQEQFKELLSTSCQMLESAKNASVLKRIFSGIRKENIENDIKTYENKYKISQLELLSFEKTFYSLIQEQKIITARIKTNTKVDQQSGEILTIDLIRKKKADLLQKNQNRENEVSNLQRNLAEAQKTILKEKLVIATTIARACIDQSIIKEKFDVLIVDEASMAPLPNIFYLAGLCSSHYVISGDFRQLSPIAQGRTPAVQKWLKRDIFSQAGILERVDSNRDDERLVMLREQYRMHPSICNLISEVVYDGKLKTPENVAVLKEQFAKLPPFEDKALIFCDTATTDPYIARPKNSFSRISPYSAVVSANLALKCVQEASKKGLKIKVGVVTPYSAQAKLISRILYDNDADPTQIVASTIHRFQGSERDCIIFDLVEGKPLSPGLLTQGPFRRSEPGRLINVAISRAMGKFFLVGNSEYIDKNFGVNDAIPQVLEQIRAKGEIVDSSITGCWSNGDNTSSDQTKIITGSNFAIYDQTNFYQAFLEDMKRAKSRIVIFSPFISRKRVETLLADFHNISQKGVPIYIIARKTKSEVVDDLLTNNVKIIFASKELGFEEFDKFHFKLALVDNSVIYYGSLNILAQFESAESMIAFRAKKTVAQLIRNFGIDSIIKEYLANQNTNSRLSNSEQKPTIRVISENTKPENQPNVSGESFIRLQKTDISNPTNLVKAFGKVQPGKEVRLNAERRIWQIGQDLGFKAYTEYEALNLFNDGYKRFISVIWKEGNEIKAAFQIRRKATNLNFAESQKDRRKLDKLVAAEKYLVNVSEKTGVAVFFRVTEVDNRNLWVTKDSPQKVRPNYDRAYENWTEAEVQDLIAEYKQNLTIREIAQKHQRRRTEIRVRLGRLGLT